MGGRGASSATGRAAADTRLSAPATADSRWPDRGLVPLLENDYIGLSSDYQGKNLGSGRAYSEYSIDDAKMTQRIEEMQERSPTLFDNESSETLRQLSSVKDGDSIVTVYRATVGNSINHGDWVFMSEQQADSWARGTFSKKPRPGYRVIAARVPARMVGYSGKNLEFVMR